MNLEEIKDYCRHGYTGLIPGWTGYLNYNYSTNQIYFHNNSYTMSEDELNKMLKNRCDLYYII